MSANPSACSNLHFPAVTFDKSLSGYAARTDQKKCLFPTLLQTWPLISIPVLRAGKGHKRDIHGRNYVIITLIRTPSKMILQTISNSHISLLFLSLALASSDTSEIWRSWQMLWYLTFFTPSSSNCGNFPHLQLMIMAFIVLHWFLVPRILAALVFPGKFKRFSIRAKRVKVVKKMATSSLTETMNRRSQMASFFVFVQRR